MTAPSVQQFGDEGFALHGFQATFVSRQPRNIKEVKQLRQKIAGSSPGGSATLLANKAVEQIGLEPGKDVSVLQMSGNAASRFAVLEPGVVDASLLSVPENIVTLGKG